MNVIKKILIIIFKIIGVFWLFCAMITPLIIKEDIISTMIIFIIFSIITFFIVKLIKTINFKTNKFDKEKNEKENINNKLEIMENKDKCKFCGAIINNDAVFCGECGKKLTDNIDIDKNTKIKEQNKEESVEFKNKQENNKVEKEKFYVYTDDISYDILDYKFINNYVVLDTETTGLNSVLDKITEFAIVAVKDYKTIYKFNTLINPKINIPNIVEKKTGITNEMVKEKKTIDNYLPKLKDILENNIIVGHNIRFDIEFIGQALRDNYILDKDIRVKYIDTLSLSRRLIDDVSDYKLETLKDYMNVNIESHRALSDCLVTNKLYLFLLKKLIKEKQEELEVEKLKKIEQENRYNNLNDEEKSFINYFMDEAKKINKKDNISTEIMKDYSIKFYFENLYLGKVRLRGKNLKMILVNDGKSFELNNLTYDEICKHSKIWIKQIEKQN